jgi:Cu-processing system permease protein
MMGAFYWPPFYFTELFYFFDKAASGVMRFITDVLLALRLALKAKFLWLVAGVWILVAAASLLSAHFGGRQPSTVALDVGFSITKLLLPLLVVLLAQELLSKEFEKRYYLSSLACPRGRKNFLFSRFVALLVVSLGTLLVSALIQVGIIQLVKVMYPQSSTVMLGSLYWIVVGFFALDLLVLATLATLLAVIASTPSFVLIGVFGFMLVARSYGAVVDLLGKNAGLVINEESYRSGLGMLSYVLPDLGALDLRMLALYGRLDFLPLDWYWLLLSGFFYALGLLALATWALQCKRFA